MRFVRVMVFVFIAVLTGFVIQCGGSGVGLFDGGPDSEAQAEVSIPEDCCCGEPLTDLERRLEALEERVDSLEGGFGSGGGSTPQVHTGELDSNACVRWPIEPFETDSIPLYMLLIWDESKWLESPWTYLSVDGVISYCARDEYAGEPYILVVLR